MSVSSSTRQCSMQSKSHSLAEVSANLITGIIFSWLLTFYALPVFGLHPNVTDASFITLIFTVASIIRQYTLRRLFNRLQTMNVPSWKDLKWTLTHKCPCVSITPLSVRICRPLVRWVSSRRTWTATLWRDLSKTFSRFG